MQGGPCAERHPWSCSLYRRITFQSCDKEALLTTRTANKSARVDEDTTFDTGKFGEVIVADTTPLFRECFAAVEAFRGDWNSLDAPVAPTLIRVQDVKRLLCFRDLEGRFELK